MKFISAKEIYKSDWGEWRGWQVWFYGLQDPETKEICYIGRTEHPNKRRAYYVSKPGMLKNGNAQLTRWLNRLHDQQLEPNFKILDVNNMSAPYHTWGNLFSAYEQVPVLNWPKDSTNYHISMSTGLLVGGIDNYQNIHLSTLRHRTHGCDFYPGPLDTVIATIDTATAFQYDRIWSVTRDEIELFNQMYDAGTFCMYMM